MNTILIILNLILCGCSMKIFIDPYQPVYDYSKLHHVSCNSRNTFDYDSHLRGGEIVNGETTSQYQDIQYICTDGHIITINIKI